MDFGLSSDQRLFQESLAGTLARVAPLERVRAFAEGENAVEDAVWGALAEIGVAGVMIGETDGGAGLGLLDAALVAEALGATVAPSPFLSSAVLAPLALPARSPWLAKLAAGEARAAVAIAEPLAGTRDGAGVVAEAGRLTGVSLFVLDAPADLFIVADRSGGLHQVERGARGLACSPLTTIDRTRRLAELRLNATPATPLPGARLDRLRDAAWVILAADMLGASQTMLDKAVAYAGERRQFGRLIGSFQGLKHLLAEMAARLEPCRALVWYAAHAFDALPDEASLAAAHAKAHLSEVSRFVARSAVEAHGGVGFTELLGLHFWFKRIGLSRQLLGGPERVRRLAAEVRGLASFAKGEERVHG